MNEGLDANKITAEVITDLAKSIAKKLFEKGKSYFTDIKNQEDIDFGTAFEEYLTYTAELYSKLKTLLYKQTPQFIYSFYEPVGIMRNKKNISSSDINNILEIGHRIIVTGTGGIGKSVMLKHFFLDTIKRTSLVPVFVELRNLNNLEKDNINIEKHIYTIMRNLKFNLEKKYFDYSLDMGCFVILLDGFDELKNTISDTVAQQIIGFCDKYPNNYYVISSRPMQEFIGWNQFEEVKAMRLTKKQALSLIDKLDYDDIVKKRFAKALDEELYDKYKSFASTPLLLTIMLLTFENRYSMPDKLNDFYDQAFMALFHTHDATKGGYSRENSSKLGFEDFKLVFSYFCFKSFFNSDFEFTNSKAIEYIEKSKTRGIISKDFDSVCFLEDLTKSVCMLVQDGLNYVFSHRSFQEYFAAVYTVQLSDVQQKAFIRKWLMEKTYRANSSFLNMLYDLQPARFVKNLIAPAIEELNNQYIMNNKSVDWLLKELVGKVIVLSDDNDEEKNFIGAYIINHYYYEMIMRACTICNFKPSNNIQNDEFINRLVEKYGIDQDILLSELLDSEERELIILELKWVKDRFEFAVANISLSRDDFREKDMKEMLDEF